MLKTKKLCGNSIYLLRGLPSANSHEIISKSEIKIFLRFFNRFLKNYVRILEYSICKDGWEILVKIKDLRTLRKYISKDSKCKNCIKWDAGRIIGERIRIFRLQLRKKLNKLRGRKGNCTHCSYEKFKFKSKYELHKVIIRLRNGDNFKGQFSTEFLASSKKYDSNGEIKSDELNGMSLLTSFAIRELGYHTLCEYHNFKLKILKLLDYSKIVIGS